jgi:Flp pilus assembly protein TadB
MFGLLSSAPPWLMVILGIFALVVIVGWILLPLILMNTNAYLRRVLREQQRTNELLEAMRPPRRTESADVPSVRA